MTYQISPMTHSPVSGAAYVHKTLVDAGSYRQRNPNLKWLYNPWGGKLRDLRDLAADPYGHAIAPPGEPMRAVLMQSGCDKVVFDAGLSPQPIVPATIENRISPLETLARNLLDPEMYGLQVSAEIRNHARRALGINFRE